MTDRWLMGRTAVVTGGSRGIGRAIALELGRRGAAVAICHRSPDGAAEVTAALEAMGVRFLAANADVSRPDDVEAFFARVAAEIGPVDILVNNAGAARDRLFIFLDKADWDDVVQVNLTGAFLCSKAVIRGMMVRRWGASSTSSLQVPTSALPASAAIRRVKPGLSASRAPSRASRLRMGCSSTRSRRASLKPI